MKVKFAGALPKADGNEIDGATLRQIVDDRTQGRSSRPRAALLIFDTKDVAIDDEGTETVTLRVRWIQSVMSTTGRRAVQELLDSEYRTQNGVVMLPHELDALHTVTFGDLPRTAEQVDEDQERQRENMSPTDELRQHLRVVHGIPDVGGMTVSEMQTQHDADHAGDMPEPMRHEAGWFGWTRADLEHAEIEADAYDNVVASDAGVPIVGDDEPDADGSTDGSRAGSPHESSGPEQAGSVTHVEFGGRG